MTTEATEPVPTPTASRRPVLRRGGRWFLLVSILLLLAGVLYMFRPVSLLERSTPLISLQENRSGQGNMPLPVWRSERELLLVDYSNVESIRVERLDTETGKRNPAPDVERVLNPSNAIPLFSPDGKWMLLTAQSAEKETLDRLFWKATTVDQSGYFEWVPADPKAFHKFSYHVAWLPDSRHVAEFLPLEHYQYGVNDPIGPLQVHLHDVQTGEDRSFSFAIPKNAARFGFQAFDTCILPDNHPLLLRLDNETNNNEIGFRSVSFFVWDSALPNAPPRSWKVSAPPGYKAARILVAPSGKQIAWVFVKSGLSSLDLLLTQLHLTKNAKPRLHLMVDVSRLDGSGMRSLGALTFSDNDMKKGEDPWATLQWTPGEKRLSYAYRNILYTIPVE